MARPLPLEFNTKHPKYDPALELLCMIPIRHYASALALRHDLGLMTYADLKRLMKRLKLDKKIELIEHTLHGALRIGVRGRDYSRARNFAEQYWVDVYGE